MNGLFHRISVKIANAVGSSQAFLLSCLIVLVWALAGPLFDYSDTWQLVINTGTTVVTFLIVFLIQNTQNRDARVMQLKLDELIKSVRGARNNLVDLEETTDEQLDELQEQYRRLREKIEAHQRKLAQKK